MISVDNKEISYNTTLSTIYQLNSNHLSITKIELRNITLVSFLHVSGFNNTSHLAYITTDSTQNTQYTLNLMDFQSLNSTSKLINGPGILAVGGNSSQNLFLIQADSIDEYRLGDMDFAHTTLQTQLDILPGTTGKVLSYNETDYISVYNPERKTLDLLVHHAIDATYESIRTSNNYLNLGGNNATQVNNGTNPQLGTTSSLPSKPSSSFSSTESIKPSSTTLKISDRVYLSTKPTTSVAGKFDVWLVKHMLNIFLANELSTKIMTSTVYDSKNSYTPGNIKHIDINKSTRFINSRLSGRGDLEEQLRKRGIVDDGNQVTSSDRSYVYQKLNISSEDNSPISIVALVLSKTSVGDQPYEIYYVSGNDTLGYNVEILVTQETPDDESVSNLGGGAIAGIVIGILAFIVLVAGLLYYTKKSKRVKNPTLRSYNSRPLSMQPDVLETRYMTAVNHSKTSSILQETKYVPGEYRDVNRPDIRPLSYMNDKVDYAELSDNELLLLEPDVQGPLFLFSGVYTSHEDEKVTYLKEGYAIRTFDADDGRKHTIHYFSSANLDTFVRSVFAIVSCSSSTGEKYIMKSERAIVLCKPTPQFNYQYIWITSPMIPQNSLSYLLFERTSWTFVDHHNADYKIWSIYSILKSIETLHSHRFVHLAIDLQAFYYDHETKATDWRLGNFGYAQSTLNPVTLRSPYTSFTAPEIVYYSQSGSELSDLWSVGCVIYTVATGGQLLFEDHTHVKNLVTFNDDMKQYLKVQIRDQVDNPIFKTILEDLLKVDPFQRKNISQVLDYWNGIYNMDE